MNEKNKKDTWWFAEKSCKLKPEYLSISDEKKENAANKNSPAHLPHLLFCLAFVFEK